MIYIGIGHDVSVWSHPEYLKLVRDAILWAKPAVSRLDPAWITARKRKAT